MRNGFDPEVPQVIAPYELPVAPLMIGHTWSIKDDSEPIYCDVRNTVSPFTPYVEGRCEGCVARHSLVTGTDTKPNVLVTEHQQGCTWFTEMLANGKLVSE